MLGGLLVSLVYTPGYVAILDTDLSQYPSSGIGTYIK